MIHIPALWRRYGEWPHLMLAAGLILAAGVVEARDSRPATADSADTAEISEQASDQAQEAMQPIQVALVPEAAAPAIVRRSEALTVRRGDTLMNMLVKASVPRQDAHEAISALRDVYDPRRLRPGQQLQVTFEESNGGAEAGQRFAELMLEPDFRRHVVVRRQADGGYTADEVEKVITPRMVVAEGRIDGSLYVAASRQGIPAPVILKLIRTYSFDVDFQRDIQRDDRFRVMYEELVDAEGQMVGVGEMVHAKLTLSGKDLPIYRHATADGDIDYYDDKGKSVRKTLLRTPIDGARISSRYGKRRHPILGYTRMHRGLDFAAPSGTPIYAAGNGVIDYAGRKGNYGKYVRIRHNSEYKTAYAHLRSYARGIRRGARVEQGDVIGYVGSTGMSTGPHLHYEIIIAGKQVNPLKVRFPAGRVLKGKELDAFKLAAGGIDTQYASLSGRNRQAATETCTAPPAATVC